MNLLSDLFGQNFFTNTSSGLLWDAICLKILVGVSISVRKRGKEGKGKEEKGKKRKGEKKNRGKEEKGKRRKREKKKRRKEEKGERRKGEKKNIGKGRLVCTFLVGLESPESYLIGVSDSKTARHISYNYNLVHSR